MDAEHWCISTQGWQGHKERKSILYLTTKHNSNQKQLEFAGCSINSTASSSWPLCPWVATLMLYNAQRAKPEPSWHTGRQTHKHKKNGTHRDKRPTPRGLGIATAMRKTLTRQEHSDKYTFISHRERKENSGSFSPPLLCLCLPVCTAISKHTNKHTQAHMFVQIHRHV